MNNHPSAAELQAFAASALRACKACEALSPQAAALQLATDGLLAILAPEPLGLDLHRAFARPVIAAAAHSRLGFSLVETLAASSLLAAATPRIAEAVLAGQELLTATRVALLRADALDGEFLLNGVTGECALVQDAHWLLTPITIGAEGRALAIVDLRAIRQKVESRGELDIGRPCGVLSLTDHPIPASHVVVQADLLSAYHADELILRALDLHACAQSALDLAVAHVSTRSQFGRKLVSFQALRHDLARARMALENGERLVEQALASASLDTALADAEQAYAHAAAVMPGIAEIALQMHGGMGFTWDVPVHLYLRRIRAQIAGFGAAQAREQVAERAIAQALLPLSP